MKTTKFYTIVFSAFLIITFSVRASASPVSGKSGKTWHVALSGNDSNDGSETKPFKTIQTHLKKIPYKLHRVTSNAFKSWLAYST